IEPFQVGPGKRSGCRPNDEQTFLLADNFFLVGGNDIIFQHLVSSFQQAVVAIESLGGGLRSTVFTHGHFLHLLLTAPSYLPVRVWPWPWFRIHVHSVRDGNAPALRLVLILVILSHF